MMKHKKKIALVTLIVTLLNLLLPYGLIRPAEAYTGTLEEKPFTVKNLGVSGDVLQLEIGVDSQEKLTGFDFSFKVDSTVGTPCQSSGAAGATFAKVMKKATDFDDLELTQQKGTYTATTQTFRITATYSAGGIEQGGYQELYWLYIKLNSGVDASTLALDDVITMVPVTGSLPTGLKVSYINASGSAGSRDISALKPDGFAEVTKSIASIAVTTRPSKTTYTHGDTVTRADISDGELTVTYDDGSTEAVSMSDVSVKITGGSPADVSNPNVQIEYKGNTTTYPITVNDPVTSLTVTSPMTKTEYNTGENFEFTGLALQATKKSGATVNLTQSSTGVTTSETQASVDSPNFTLVSSVPNKSGTQVITFTYEGKTATQTTVVNDHIASIDVTAQPTKKVYKRGESLNLAGAKVTITLGSGATAVVNLPDGMVQVTPFNPTTTGSYQDLEASITVGSNTFIAPTKIRVEAYNYISGHTFTQPTKDTYKYGDALVETGGKFTFTWASGSGSPASVSMPNSKIAVTGYSATTVGIQLVTAAYTAEYTLADGSTKITDTISDVFYVEVENPAKSITITAPTNALTFNHGDAWSFGNGVIDVELYDGTHQYPSISAATVTEVGSTSAVNMSPAASAYGASTHTLTKQVKVSYSQDSKTASKTYSITLNNPIDSLSIGTSPQTTFNVGEYETSLTPGGTIVPKRKAGDTDEPVNITSSMVSGLSTTTAGTGKTATVSYTDPAFSTVSKSTTYTYNVVDSTISIAINNAPTTSKYGVPLNLGSATLTVTKGSGPVTIPATSGSISGFSSSTLGPQTVTIEYDGKSTTFPVTVQDYVEKIILVPNSTSDVLGTSLANVISNNNLKYQVKYKSESSARSAVPLTTSMVAGYNPNSATQSLTVTYTDNDTNSFSNGSNFNETLNISLSNNVDTINFRVAPTKITYKDNESLDLTGAIVDLTYENGDPGTGNLANVTYTLTDGSPLSMTTTAADYQANGNKVTRDVLLTYTDPTTGKTGTKTYTITIVNDVRSIAMQAIPKQNYYIGDTLDLTVDGTNYGSILVTRAVGIPEAVDLDDPNITVTGFSSAAVANNLPITVKYRENDIEKGTSYPVNIKNIVTKVEFEDAPIKTEYQHGDPIDITGIKVKLTYADGTTGWGLVSDIVVTESGSSTINMSPATTDYDLTTHKLTKTVDLRYDDALSGKYATTTYTFDIIDTVQDVKIHTEPTQKTYNIGESIDLTGGEIEIYRASNPTVPEVVSMLDGAGNPVVAIKDFESTREHATLTVTAEYTENSVTMGDTFDVAVIDSVSKIEIQNPPTVGKVGEALDLSATTIDVTKGSGSFSKAASEATVSGYDPNTVGTQTVTLSYGGKSDTFNIVVKDYVTKITVAPKSVNAALSDTVQNILDDNNVQYVVTFKSAGDQPAAPVTSSMVSGYTAGAMTQTLTVEYVDDYTDSFTNGQRFTDTFGVTLANSVLNVKINGTPTKTTYKHGEAISYDGLSITLSLADGSTAAGSVSNLVATESDGITSLSMTPAAGAYGTDYTLTKNILVTYTDADSGKSDTINYPITIINDVRSIDMFSTPKQNYNIGDALDKTGGEIEVTRAVGSPDIVPMTDSRVSVEGFNSSVENTNLPLTVKFTENGISETITYPVSVIDSVTSVVIKTYPKQNYKYNEPLDVTTGVLTVTRGSGPEEVSMNDSMVKELSGTPFDPTTLGTRNLKVKYGGKEVYYEVTIKDYVTGITLNPDTVAGKYNDELATLITSNSIKYTVNYAKAGPKAAVLLPTTMVTTAYDKTSTTEQTLDVEYVDNDVDSATNGDTFKAELKVTLSDDVSAIAMNATPKTSYEYGDTLSVSGGTINVTRISGVQEIAITPDMVTELDSTPFDSTNMSTRNLLVTYEGKTTQYEVTVSDAVSGINFQAPNKVTYNYNEALDLTGGYLQKVMKSGAATPRILLTDSDVTVSGYIPTQVGAQTVTVEYEGKYYTYGVAVNDGITSIEITTLPTNVSYQYGDALDTTGGVITVHYAASADQTKPITPSMVTGYDPNTLGTQTLTVEYQGFTDTYNVSVADYVRDIEIVAPNKLTYAIGDSLDLTGGTVQAVMASGAATTPVAMSSVSVSGFDSTTEGVKTIQVTYQGITKTFGVTVSDATTGWSILSVPDKLTYRYGDPLDLTGAKLVLNKESGATERISVTSDMVSGYNPNRLGNQTLNVTYEGETKEFTIVTVEDYISKLNVKAPTKTVYHYGDDIDLTGGTVSIVMASGAIQETTDLTASMISGYDPTSVGTQTIPVEYKDLTGSFTIKLIDEVKGVSINTEPYKKEYNYGDGLDVTGGTLTVVKDSGVYTVPMTNNMASGYSATTPGNQVVTITYEGKTVTYVVKVNNKPEEEKPQETTTTTTTTPKSSGRSGGTRVIYVSTPAPQTTTPTPTPVPEPTPTPSPEPAKEVVKETPKETNKTTNKTIRTLGAKEENKENTEDKGDWRKPILGAIIGITLLLLLLLLILKRNVKVYVQEDKTKDEFVLGGLDKIKKNNPKLDIDKFLDEETNLNKVKVVLNDSISEKLDGKEIEIKHRGQTKTVKVKYEDKPFEFILY